MTTDVHSALEESRLKAAGWILQGCLAIGVLVTVCGLLLPVRSVLPGVIALGSIVVGYGFVRTRHRHYRLVLGQVTVAQSIGLVATLSGTGWQMDAHMLFFVSLSALVGLVDVRALLMAAVTIVLHHLTLGVFLPQLVFPSVDFVENIERVLFHGVIVGMAVAVLCWAVSNRLRLTAQVQNALTSAQTAADEAASAGAGAEAARAKAEAEADRAHLAQSKAEQLVVSLNEEQTAREAANRAAGAAEEQAAELQKEQMEAQAQVVTALRGGLARIADGDLSGPITAPFPPGYEPLRNDYNCAIDTLASVLARVADNTSDLMGRVAGVNSSANELAGRTDAQVSSLEATTRSIENLQTLVRASTDNAKETARAAGTVKADAVAGGDIVRRVINAMTDIEGSSQEIAKINAAMDAIAFQTNLLALNAGVEAARAGEAGRGFSVVASEVRALSRRATEAARGINELTERSGQQVQEGVTLVTDAGKALDGIVGAIADMTSAVEQIADAAEEQSDGLHVVSTSVNELDAVAQSNAVMFEETSAACQTLTAGMGDIAASLETFKLKAGAQAAVSDPPCADEPEAVARAV